MLKNKIISVLAATTIIETVQIGFMTFLTVPEMVLTVSWFSVLIYFIIKPVEYNMKNSDEITEIKFVDSAKVKELKKKAIALSQNVFTRPIGIAYKYCLQELDLWEEKP
ncbi:hypothetical protein [uncultured Robinsoniella sp.]|uniref:hypothetical protein n=1 Tax=uncultured Robinsoniella sp. TaxID=904190 RepID=UPI00374EA3B1